MYVSVGYLLDRQNIPDDKKGRRKEGMVQGRKAGRKRRAKVKRRAGGKEGKTKRSKGGGHL